MKYEYVNVKLAERPKDFPETPWMSFDMSQREGKSDSASIRNAMANPDMYFESKGTENGLVCKPVYVYHSKTKIFEVSSSGTRTLCPTG